MATQIFANALNDPLNVSAPTAKGKFQEYQGIEQQLGTLRPQQQEFEGLTAADLAERESRKLGRKAEALGGYRTQVEAPELKAERTALEEEIKPFVPSVDNAQDLASIFSLIGVLGFAIGAGGKGHAIQAMTAMNGMMEGYQAGRQDVYKREKDLFESNTKALKTKIDSINSKMKEIAQLAAIDYQKADLEADMLFAQEGADFLKKYKDKVGLAKTIKALEEKSKAAEKMYEFLQKEERIAYDKEKDRQLRLDMQQRRENIQITIEGMRERARADLHDRKKADTTKMVQKDRDAYNLREELIPQIEMSIPILDRINQEGNWPKMTGLLAVDPRAAEFAFKDDLEALSLIRTFARFRSKEFETAGKALTKTEDKILSPLYRADLRAYEAVRNAMATGVDEMKKEQSMLQRKHPAQSEGGGWTVREKK